MKNSVTPKIPVFSIKMTTRNQNRKAVEEVVSHDLETPIAGNNQTLILVAGLSKSPRIQPQNLDEIKTSLRNEILADLTEILAENQKEIN